MTFQQLFTQYRGKYVDYTCVIYVRPVPSKGNYPPLGWYWYGTGLVVQYRPAECSLAGGVHCHCQKIAIHPAFLTFHISMEKTIQ